MLRKRAIAKAASTYDDVLERRGGTKSISGRGLAAEELFPTYIATHPLAGDLIKCEVSGTKESEVRYRGKVGIGFGLSDVVSRFGFDSPDIIPAIWEAIPFSFLIDYFTNCNDVFARLSRGSIRSETYLRYAVKGVKNTNRITQSGYSPTSQTFYDVAAGGGSAVSEKITIHRSSIDELPPVVFEFQAPSLRQSFNVGALITAVNASKPLMQK